MSIGAPEDEVLPRRKVQKVGFLQPRPVPSATVLGNSMQFKMVTQMLQCQGKLLADSSNDQDSCLSHMEDAQVRRDENRAVVGKDHVAHQGQ